MDSQNEDIRDLQSRAAAAFEQGRLAEAKELYGRLVALRPNGDAFHFRLALAHKYLRDWPQALRHNLESLRLAGEPDEGASWNAGIAATALGDWAEARRQWTAIGIELDAGDGPIEENFGPIGLRLNPWATPETVFAQRIDPARARITNVPLPESGHRYGDIVLHDGAQVGERHYFDHTVPVFNGLQRLAVSDFATYTVFVGAVGDEDVEALQRMRVDGVALVEDWTAALKRRCLRCAYDIPHKHHWLDAGGNDWNPDRTLGIAARQDEGLRRLLEAWVADAPERRRLDAIQCRELPAPEFTAGRAWWKSDQPRK
jgi:tetratricopeptide (TPR) repeat protein